MPADARAVEPLGRLGGDSIAGSRRIIFELRGIESNADVSGGVVPLRWALPIGGSGGLKIGAQ